MRRLVLACAALACLVGCSGQPDPIEPTSGSSSKPRTSPSPTSTLTPPAFPKLAERNDATGAANFVLYWVKVSNYAALTGDTELLRSISSPDCEGCNRYIELYERTYAAGGYFKGSGWRLGAPEVTNSDGRFQIFAHVSAPAGTYKSMKSRRSLEGTPEDTDMVFETQRISDAWVISQLVLRSQWES